MNRTVMWVALAVLALIVVVLLVLEVVGALLKFLVYVIIAVALVGGGLYLVSRARAALRGGRREIR